MYGSGKLLFCLSLEKFDFSRALQDFFPFSSRFWPIFLGLFKDVFHTCLGFKILEREAPS